MNLFGFVGRLVVGIWVCRRFSWMWRVVSLLWVCLSLFRGMCGFVRLQVQTVVDLFLTVVSSVGLSTS